MILSSFQKNQKIVLRSNTLDDFCSQLKSVFQKR